MRTIRYHLGRALILCGLRALPKGRVKDELQAIMQAWTRNVIATVWLDRVKRDGDAAVSQLFEFLDKNHRKALTAELEKSA